MRQPDLRGTLQFKPGPAVVPYDDHMAVSSSTLRAQSSHATRTLTCADSTAAAAFGGLLPPGFPGLPPHAQHHHLEALSTLAQLHCTFQGDSTMYHVSWRIVNGGYDTIDAQW